MMMAATSRAQARKRREAGSNGNKKSYSGPSNVTSYADFCDAKEEFLKTATNEEAYYLEHYTTYFRGHDCIMKVGFRAALDGVIARNVRIRKECEMQDKRALLQLKEKNRIKEENRIRDENYREIVRLQNEKIFQETILAIKEFFRPALTISVLLKYTIVVIVLYVYFII